MMALQYVNGFFICLWAVACASFLVYMVLDKGGDVMSDKRREHMWVDGSKCPECGDSFAHGNVMRRLWAETICIECGGRLIKYVAVKLVRRAVKLKWWNPTTWSGHQWVEHKETKKCNH